MGVLDLFAFKDPNIIQYTIYDKRNDDTVLSLGEHKGGFIFAFSSFTTSFSEYQKYLDVRIEQYELVNGEVTSHSQISVDQYT